MTFRTKGLLPAARLAVLSAALLTITGVYETGAAGQTTPVTINMQLPVQPASAPGVTPIVCGSSQTGTGYMGDGYNVPGGSVYDPNGIHTTVPGGAGLQPSLSQTRTLGPQTQTQTVTTMDQLIAARIMLTLSQTMYDLSITKSPPASWCTVTFTRILNIPTGSSIYLGSTLGTKLIPPASFCANGCTITINLPTPGGWPPSGGNQTAQWNLYAAAFSALSAWERAFLGQ